MAKLRITQAKQVEYDTRLNRIQDNGLGELDEDALIELEAEAVAVESDLAGWEPYTHVVSVESGGMTTYYLAQVEE